MSWTDWLLVVLTVLVVPALFMALRDLYQRRRNLHQRNILRAMSAAPDRPWTGLELVQAGVVSRGAVYVVLGLMEDRRLVTREVLPPDYTGLPRTRVWLTSMGKRFARTAREVG